MSTILIWAWTPNERLSPSSKRHQRLSSSSLGVGKHTDPQPTTSTGPGWCSHRLMERRPPPPRRRATGVEYQRRLSAPQVSLFVNFLMCPPTCLRGITSCLPPAQLSSPPCGRSPPSGGDRGVPGAPAPRELAARPGRRARGRGLFTRRQVLAPPPARPPPGPARPAAYLGSPV